MVKTLTFNADVPPNRELRITLPADVPVGSAAIVVTVSSAESAAATFGDLLDSEFFGMWRNRAEIADSMEYARKLRSQSWDRPAK